MANGHPAPVTRPAKGQCGSALRQGQCARQNAALVGPAGQRASARGRRPGRHDAHICHAGLGAVLGKNVEQRAAATESETGTGGGLQVWVGSQPCRPAWRVSGLSPSLWVLRDCGCWPGEWVALLLLLLQGWQGVRTRQGASEPPRDPPVAASLAEQREPCAEISRKPSNLTREHAHSISRVLKPSER